MEKLVKKLAAELAKFEFNELANIVSEMSFIDAYNVLNGFNLDMDECWYKDELMSLQIRFHYKFKHINSTIFRTEDGGCELCETISVWDDEFSSPIIEYLEMEC